MTFNGTNVVLSARSEEYFNNELKNLIFKSIKNIHVDKFLISHRADVALLLVL